MIRLSAFADEISPDLPEQIAILKRENIAHIDLRGVWNINVLDLTDEQAISIKELLEGHGIKVAAIGSPIGKVPIDSPFDEHLERFERAIRLAHLFGTPLVRIFSFYPPTEIASDTIDPDSWRDEVVWRLREMTTRARAAGITLIHENEKGIYGDSIARCVDLLQECNDSHFQAVFDPANFIQCGQIPYPDAYEALRPWLRYVHVKDALPDGEVVAAGEGAARWPELLQCLRQDGYDGFFSLEPHLASAGTYQGFSGPDLFRYASQALQQMLQSMGWEYA
jgi:3-dehydroshikimate dehydratase